MTAHDQIFNPADGTYITVHPSGRIVVTDEPDPDLECAAYLEMVT